MRIPPCLKRVVFHLCIFFQLFFAVPASQGDSQTKVSDTVLRIARSSDGLGFENVGKVFLEGATAPDLLTLPGGAILALFDQVHPDDPSSTRIMVTRSQDGGESWLRPRPMELRTGREKVSHPRHPDLVFTPNGGYRLYFTSSPTLRSTSKRKKAEPSIIRSAITNDGVRYRLDPRTRFLAANDRDVHPVVAELGGQVHLYHAVERKRKSSKGDRIQHLISRGGRRFSRMRPSSTPRANFVGSVTPTQRDVRAYVSNGKSIQLLVSKDGRDWLMQKDTQLPRGWDPAVTQLDDGSWLMLYCAAKEDSPVDPNQIDALADAYWDDADAIHEWEVFDDYYSEDSIDEAEQLAVVSDVAADEGGEGDPAIVALAVGEEEPVEETDQSVGDQSQVDWKDSWDPLESDGYAPLPDFEVEVDYMEWYREFLLEQPEDNAYFAYAEFMPREGFKDDPRFNDMFNGDQNEGPPAPWDPDDHPEWEESYQSTQEMIQQYREAGKREGYASPPNDAEYLMGIELPALSPHRTMAKATLAAAWRKRGGKVSPEDMLDAWEAVLRAASHLERGATLIEDLVATAERSLVQDNARRALQHEVFSPNQLGWAIDTLQEFDRRDEEPAQSVRGEHGFVMDTVQQIFSPPTPDGQPQLNRERLDKVLDWVDHSKDIIQRTEEMAPEDVRATLRGFDSYYREVGQQMNIGYPQVRGSDITKLAQQYMNISPLSEAFLPVMGRIHQLRARDEASRRATQLAYAVHIFKDRNGRFPQSLDELGDEYGNEMRIDPFSGQYFGYKLTKEGPRIWSVSENGKNDGGVHSPTWGAEKQDDAEDAKPPSDDYVFWPPQKN